MARDDICEIYRAALEEIGGRWKTTTAHEKEHPEDCEVVICVAKRALKAADEIRSRAAGPMGGEVVQVRASPRERLYMERHDEHPKRWWFVDHEDGCDPCVKLVLSDQDLEAFYKAFRSARKEAE